MNLTAQEDENRLWQKREIHLEGRDHESPFNVTDLVYHLPEELIAQQPPTRRQDARLLVLHRKSNQLQDCGIDDLPDLLNPGDLLVLNDTRVIPARFFAKRMTGGRIEGLFMREIVHGRWSVMLRNSRRLRVGERMTAADSNKIPNPKARTSHPNDPISCLEAADRSTNHEELSFTLLRRLDEGQWEIEVDSPESAMDVLQRIGRTPLPPYIRRDANSDRNAALDRDRYQTVYAAQSGAVAAPTAGLHFTPELLQRINDRGIHTTFVTLHVGQGTFKPIESADIRNHKMHEELFEFGVQAARDVENCRRSGGRVIAVGTTSVRVLETVAVTQGAYSKTQQELQPAGGSTDIFIYPAYQFRIVNGLLTNFHLPRSTLLALVMAFADIEPIRRAYEHAVASRYRFYSYGDAMLIL